MMIILVLTIFMINDNADHQKVKLSESMIVLTSYDDDYDDDDEYNDHNDYNHHKITKSQLSESTMVLTGGQLYLMMMIWMLIIV